MTRALLTPIQSCPIPSCPPALTSQGAVVGVVAVPLPFVEMHQTIRKETVMTVMLEDSGSVAAETVGVGGLPCQRLVSQSVALPRAASVAVAVVVAHYDYFGGDQTSWADCVPLTVALHSSIVCRTLRLWACESHSLLSISWTPIGTVPAPSLVFQRFAHVGSDGLDLG